MRDRTLPLFVRIVLLIWGAIIFAICILLAYWYATDRFPWSEEGNVRLVFGFLLAAGMLWTAIRRKNSN